MNELLEFLKNYNARVSYEDKWLCVDAESNGENRYTVYQRKHRKKKAQVLYDGHYLSVAIATLAED